MPGFVDISFEVEADVSVYDAVENARSYDASFRIELQPVGAGGAVSGKAAGHVQFGARDCATGNVPAVVTKKAKKQARKVLIRSNGAKVVKLKGKKLKPKTLLLPADRAAAATVSAKVVRKNGKKATVSRTYLPCA